MAAAAATIAAPLALESTPAAASELRTVEKIRHISCRSHGELLECTIDWARTRMKDLEIGDVFRMKEPNGDLVCYEGTWSWKVTATPEPYGETMGVRADPFDMSTMSLKSYASQQPYQ